MTRQGAKRWGRALLTVTVGVVVAAAQTVAADRKSTEEIVAQASQAVVHIAARSVVSSKYQKETREASGGTGFLIDSDGRILTAFHVIRDRNQIEVVLNNGDRLPARIIGTAPRLDTALLQVDLQGRTVAPLPLGQSDSLVPGEPVIAIGNALGLHNTVTVGVVSAVNRTPGDVPPELQEAMIQTDAAINPGNSGGPLLNSSGEVVGINDALLVPGQNLGFAVPISLVRAVIPDLIAMGHPYHAQLGFSSVEITPELAQLLALPVSQGLLVQQVEPGSPAYRAGLAAGERIVPTGDQTYVLGGDIVVSVNDRQVTSTPMLVQFFLRSKPGDMVKLGVQRGGEAREITLRLREMRMQ